MTDIPANPATPANAGAGQHLEPAEKLSAQPATASSRGLWIVLILWALWLAVMVLLSLPELGHKRLNHNIEAPSSEIK